MFFTVIDKSALNGESINYNSIIVRLSAEPGESIENYRDLWIALVTIVKGNVLKVLLDMSEIDFIDSKGIGILINSAKHLRGSKGDLVIINPTDKVEKIFATLNINRMIKTFDNEEEALHHLKFI